MLTAGQFLAGRYRIVRPLKQGGMGAIYEGFDDILDAPVAVKENCIADPAMRAAFEREAQLLANLRHPSLPRCSDLLSEGDGQFLVMEFVEGDDLAALMVERRAWLPNDTVADLTWQLLDVLEYIHGESVLHRDIKPANIKFKDGRACLLDFGLAYGQSGEMETIDGGKFNWKYRSKRYSPIEQTRCRRTSQVSDLYSLAATLYYLLTNVEPADAEERFECVSGGGRDPLEDVRFYNPGADEQMSRAVMQALSLGADERPQSAAELRELMFPAPSAVPESARPRRFFNVRLLSEVLVLGALAFLVFVVPVLSGPRRISLPDRPQVVTTPTPTPTPATTPAPAEEAARLMEEARSARQSGQDERAWSLVEQALAFDENNVDALRLLGDITWEAIVDSAELAERIPDVREAAEHILRLVPKPRSEQECVAVAWASYAAAIIGRSHPDAALLERAVASANEALTKYNPDSVDALTLRASATYVKAGGKIDEQTAGRVLADYERAIRLAPLYAQAHANRAEIYYTLACLGKAPSRDEYLGQAVLGFENAVALWERPVFYKQLGYARLAKGDDEKAAEAFLAAVAADSNYYPAYVGLGDYFFKEKRWEEAKTNYLTANRLNQTSERAREAVFSRLGAVYNNLGQSDLAAENCREALKLNSEDPAAKKELGRALAGRGGR